MSDFENNNELSESDSAFIDITKALEQIVETVPDDQVALEMLAHVYEETGETDKMRQCLLTLGEVIVRDSDAHLAEYVYDRMKDVGLCDEMDEAIGGLVEQLLLQKSTSQTDEYGESVVEDTSYAFKVMDELSFAWRLFEAGELNQEEYAGVAHDLTEMTVDGHLSTVSVLHSLDTRAFSGMERMMGFIARDIKIPIVTLPLFDIKDEVCNLLPLDFMIRHGALVYDLIADDALVVVMNPIDIALRKHIEAQIKKVCHYYIALPSEFNAVIKRLSAK